VLNAALDAEEANIAVLDHSGVIVAVNQPWRMFYEGNGGSDSGCGVGADYVAVCRRGAEAHAAMAGQSLVALEQILRGELQRFECHYPCHGPEEPRWFGMRMNRFIADDAPYVLVSHEIATTGSWSRETFEKLSMVARNTTSGVVIMDARAHIEWVNAAFERASGYGRSEVEGRHLAAVFGGTLRDDPKLKAMRRAVSDGRSIAMTVLTQRRDGTPFWVDLRLDAVRDPHGALHHYVAIQTDITERRTLERKVSDASAHERERIAHDLHDGLGQELTGARLLLQAAAGHLTLASPAMEPLVNAADALDRSMEEIRALAQDLAPVQLAQGLGHALELLAAHMSIPGGAPVEFAGSTEAALPRETAEQLFRIAQEAVSNSARHARARTISITLVPIPGGLELRVADDGKGFDAALRPKGRGLGIMTHRAGLIGASLHVGPGPDGGTLVTCVAPRP